MRSYSDLPPEIIFDILAASPAKSVGLCRCVCKSWRALLTQPNFIKTHLRLIKINSLAIIHESKYGSAIYSAPMHNADDQDKITLSVTKLSFSPGSWYVIYGSCDGLLLVLDGYSKLLVMNPITREISQVPHSWIPHYADAVGYLRYGFGYDSVNDEYKIVIVSDVLNLKNHRFNIFEETFVGVYSLKTGSWKRVESPPYCFVRPNSQASHTGAFVDGCLHWLAHSTKDNKDVIVSFNLVEEKFLEIPLPDVDSFIWYKLDVLAGHLCVNSRYTIIFVMNEYGVRESWTKLSVNNCYGSFKYFLNDQEQAVMEVNHTNEYTVWNLKQGTSKKIVFNGFDEDLNYTSSVEVGFVESLVSPHISNKLDKTESSCESKKHDSVKLGKAESNNGKAKLCNIFYGVLAMYGVFLFIMYCIVD